MGRASKHREQRKGDGTKVERYGTSPKGIAFFDAGGRYIITVMRADRAKYASSALWQGTPDENKETADGTITYKLEWDGPEAFWRDCRRTVDTDCLSIGRRRS